MISHIFWDWNGTLADDAVSLQHAVNAGMAAIGQAPVSTTRLRERFARPLSALYERLAGAEYAQRWSMWQEAFVAASHDDAPALAGDAIEAVERWHARGRTQSVVSRWPAADLARRINATELRFFLDGIRGARSSDEPKEHMLRQELLGRGLQPEHAVLIGDTIDDVEAARAAGVAVVVCDVHAFTPCDGRELERLAVPRVGSLCAAVDLALLL